MKLLFKQRIFSWFDSYDIFDERGQTLFTVRGQLSWGHCLRITDARGRHVGTVKEVVLALLPRFEIYIGDQLLGSIRKEFTFFKPKFTLDVNGWTIDGDWFEWDYTIRDHSGRAVAAISKQILNWSDTYIIDVPDPADAIPALMVVLAIDAEKCSRD